MLGILRILLPHTLNRYNHHSVTIAEFSIMSSKKSKGKTTVEDKDKSPLMSSKPAEPKASPVPVPATNQNAELCKMLIELGDYERNVNKEMYKYQAYRKAAAALAKHPTAITSGEEAQELKGIGVKIACKIDEFLKTGKLCKLEEVRHDDLGIAMKELTRVSGIGPSHAREFIQQGVRTLDDLRKCKDLTHHQIIGLKYLDEFEQRIPRAEMELLEAVIFKTIDDLDHRYKRIICGSYRRGAATSGDIDLLLTHTTYASDSMDQSVETRKVLLSDVIEALQKIPFITDTLAQGVTKFMGVCQLTPEALDLIKYSKGTESPKLKRKKATDKGGSSKPDLPLLHRRIDIRLIPADQYWCAVLYFTGSDEFNRRMRGIAHEKGFILNEYSIRPLGSRGAPGEPLEVHSEEDIFDYIQMEYKEPNERSE